MPRSRHVDAAFKYRHIDQEVIVLCVRWQVSYRLRYRDLVEMMADRRERLHKTTEPSSDDSTV